MVAAGPIASLLNPANANAHCVRADVVAATGNMLVVFAPQALLYGLSVVLYGLLQSYRRFAASALGPGISSLVLIACYLAFVPLNKGLPLARLPLPAELVLSVGTTLGIAALVVVAVPSTWRLRLRFRPVAALPARGGAPGRWGGAWSASPNSSPSTWRGVVGIALANGRGDDRRDRHLQLHLAGLHRRLLGPDSVHRRHRVPRPVGARGAGLRPDQRRSTRAILLMSWLGTAVIAAITVPAAHVLARHPDQVRS